MSLTAGAAVPVDGIICEHPQKHNMIARLRHIVAINVLIATPMDSPLPGA